MRPLKNPRKYVEILKRQRDEARGLLEFVHEETRSALVGQDRARGKPWFEYTDGVKQDAVLWSSQARQCRIESKVAIHGKVVKIEPSKEAGKYDITFALGGVRILEE